MGPIASSRVTDIWLKISRDNLCKPSALSFKLLAADEDEEAVCDLEGARTQCSMAGWAIPSARIDVLFTSLVLLLGVLQISTLPKAPRHIQPETSLFRDPALASQLVSVFLTDATAGWRSSSRTRPGWRAVSTSYQVHTAAAQACTAATQQLCRGELHLLTAVLDLTSGSWQCTCLETLCLVVTLSQAARAVPSIVCHTVVKLTTPDEWQLVLSVSGLVFPVACECASLDLETQAFPTPVSLVISNAGALMQARPSGSS